MAKGCGRWQGETLAPREAIYCLFLGQYSHFQSPLVGAYEYEGISARCRARSVGATALASSSVPLKASRHKYFGQSCNKAVFWRSCLKNGALRRTLDVPMDTLLH